VSESSGGTVELDGDVEGTVDTLCPRRSSVSGCRSDPNLSGITPSTGGVDVDGMGCEDVEDVVVVVGAISVTHVQQSTR